MAMGSMILMPVIVMRVSHVIMTFMLMISMGRLLVLPSRTIVLVMVMTVVIMMIVLGL